MNIQDKNNAHLRDVIIVLVISLTVFALASLFDAFEAFVAFSQQYERWEIDEIVTVLVVLSFTASVFLSIRRKQLNTEIAKRRKSEETLRESEEKFKVLFTFAPDAYYLNDLEGYFIDGNKAAEELTGYRREALIGKNFLELNLLPPEQLPKAAELLKKNINGQATGPNELILNRKDGSQILVEISTVMTQMRGQSVVLGIARDMTERKQIEEELRASEEEYRLHFENVSDVIFSIDPELKVHAVSASVEKILRYKPDEMIGLPFQELNILAPEYLTTALFDVKSVWAGEKITSSVYEFITKDGSKKIGEVSGSPLIKQGKIIGVISIARDITEKRKLKDQLHRAQRMESLGLMAGGIAHDLNNILSGIVTYPELLLMDLPEDSPLWRPIKTIQESGMRAVDVVADLLTIARGVATGKEALNLNTIVTEYLGSPEYQKLEKTHSFINFKTELDPDILNMSGSPAHIRKTLMNLVTNASEAIEGSGTVTISTNHRYLDEPLKGYEDVRQGEYAVLSVSDEGSGISPEDLERIFEPFYTKKVMGRSGTGLGLAVVWNTVQDHMGYINVKSIEKGTVFELYFPVTRDEVADEKEELPLEDYLGHGERILVVDDEERQREIAGVLLTKLGYVAEAVSSGEEAIEYVKEHPVDLIVLDMVMPKGINGRKTYEEIIKIRPGQKAIIASGYAKTKEVNLAQGLGAGKYIKKPYTLEKIGVAVKKELER